MESTAELNLINQTLKGDRRAYRTLVELHHLNVFSLVMRIVQQRELAEEIAQDVFLKAFRSLQKFKGTSKFSTWLYRIASNEAITFINKLARQQSITSEELQTTIINNLESDVYFEGNEIQLKLQRAIATLPPKQQQVFQMKYFEDITYDAMSEILETSVGALKSSYHIATKKITEHLKTN